MTHRLAEALENFNPLNQQQRESKAVIETEVGLYEGMKVGVQIRIADLEAEVNRLQAALRPFAAVTLPANWPGECVLTWEDYAFDTPEQPPIIFHGAYPGYLHHEAKGGPTIADYRRASEVMQEAANAAEEE